MKVIVGVIWVLLRPLKHLLGPSGCLLVIKEHATLMIMIMSMMMLRTTMMVMSVFGPRHTWDSERSLVRLGMQRRFTRYGFCNTVKDALSITISERSLVRLCMRRSFTLCGFCNTVSDARAR